MTGLAGSITAFYEADASLYARICNDRDFEAQARFLARQIVQTEQGGRFLELFAGPAYHSIWLERSHSITCVAIDSSSEMKREATGSNGLNPERFIIGRLPLLPALGELGGMVDGASILRYSIGYLEPLEVLQLLRGLTRVLRPGGRLVLELHDLDLVRSDFRRLDIRERVARDPDGKGLRCIWPAGPLRWQADDWVVAMDVIVQLLDGMTVVGERVFQSVERIYAKAEILTLARISGGYRSIELVGDPEGFPGATLLVLEIDPKSSG